MPVGFPAAETEAALELRWGMFGNKAFLPFPVFFMPRSVDLSGAEFLRSPLLGWRPVLLPDPGGRLQEVDVETVGCPFRDRYKGVILVERVLTSLEPPGRPHGKEEPR